ncbi:Transcriptional regulator AcuR [Thalassovita gelatinovora]|uniref:Transcriptional regulator AcuR n=1 Tax=Thalassovita gelatinovora TaxID=53501 RepID=A0A0P1F8K8_THAGE|nr:TetR/AcrR family transcriptional regulator [Thalassovita gelatinovora]QIZ80371.1 TetR family transcriptional regulator [Thalassovita gelatinovora]CUH64329.1 Transcriptional regulator AcuR [Thalassovita gelatinovora]SEQ93229.1 transcriptional regulator, TetR family [Thalassovita gelatinovora]
MNDKATQGTTKVAPIHSTKQRLIDAGLRMLLKHGYNDLGIQALLTETRIPKGSFYHHFKGKEDFALKVVDSYMTQVHAGLDACLTNPDRPPLMRVRDFFEKTQVSYREEGYMGCLLGGLGQELSGVSEVFRDKIAKCFAAIAKRVAGCLEEARKRHDIPEDSNVQEMADLLVDCWEGAALRSRLQRNPTSLDAMLDFYFHAVSSGQRQNTVQAR